MNYPKDYVSKDVIDRRNGEKPTLSDKVRDLSIAVRNDWRDMKDAEAAKSGTPVPSSPLGPKAPDPNHPDTAKPNSFKDGGVVEKTGLALVHKGERVIPVADKEKETVHLSKHRAVMHLNKGGLHRALGIDPNETIPKEKIAAARNSDNPHVREMANLAHTMEGWHKK